MALNILTKLTRDRGSVNADMADKGGMGVGEMLTLADEGGRGVGEMLTLAEKGGRGGMDPPCLADIICEQPLRHGQLCSCNRNFRD